MRLAIVALLPDYWNGANDKCTLLGGLLTSLKSPKESSFVNSIVDKSLGRYWIGRNVYGDGWADDAPGNYTNWAKYQPNWSFGRDGVYVDPSTGLWSTDYMARALPYVCKVSPVDLPTPANPTKSDQRCQPGWTYGESADQCFKAFADQATWHEAVYRCRSLGGDLAMTKDQDTVNLVAALGNGTDEFSFSNIGLYNARRCKATDPSCKWQWTDGTDVDIYEFDNWDEAPFGAGFCAVIYDVRADANYGWWAQSFCEQYAPYICQMPPFTAIAGKPKSFSS
ncbi:macrophage mannose receptor 1-like protein [Aphelenchoides avenae]|nr:macrophage mannose receptor 1-like protein [Aphelenchus avenae]